MDDSTTITIDEIRSEIESDIINELSLSGNEKEIKKVEIKVKYAVQDVIERRTYPYYYSDSEIASDLKKFKSKIHDLALYDYGQSGAEGQTAYSESGRSWSWKNRDDCLNGIVCIANIL